jgi:hypothetical protein
MRYREFIGVFVSDKDDVVSGEQEKTDLPATVNLDAVEAFNDAGEGCTCVRLQQGTDLLLRIPYSQFKRLFFYNVTPSN